MFDDGRPIPEAAPDDNERNAVPVPPDNAPTADGAAAAADEPVVRQNFAEVWLWADVYTGHWYSCCCHLQLRRLLSTLVSCCNVQLRQL